MRRALALLLAATVASSGVSARAADDDSPSQPAPDAAQEARQQYQAGMQAYQAKRFVEAALHFEAAVVQRPHAVALYTAGLAWEQASRPERAADDFSRALDVQGLSPAQAQNARDRLGTLERTMGTLEVTAPEVWRVQLDANTQVPTPAHVHAMPGVHSLAIQPPSSVIQHRDVTLELGKTTHLELAAEPPAPAEPKARPDVAPPATPLEAGSSSVASDTIDLRRSIGFGVAGAGVASLAAGAIFGVSALSARDAYNAAPTQAGYDHASSMQTWTDVTLIAGGVLVAGGAALVLWPSPKPKVEPLVSVAPTLGGMLVRGVF